GHSYETTDTLATTGGIDIITVGDGNNTILGGMAGDVITTDTGTTTRIGVDTIIGDNGIVEMDAVGNNFARIATKSQASTGGSIVDLGGNDTITAQDGTKIVLGGDGADTIKLGEGRVLASNHIVIGDNGVVNYVPMLTAGGLPRTGAGRVLSYETTDTLATTGGIDIITVGDGNNTILGGMAGDVITTDTGTTTRIGVDTIIGDNGIVEMDAVGNNFARIATKSQASTGGSIVDLGGNDTITAQDGTKIVLGGDGADTIKLGEGRVLASNHIVIGDNGVVNYVPMLTAGGLPRTGAGRVLSYETTDTLATTGGIDIITVGDGNNTILGGMAGDVITTDTGTTTRIGVDTIIGDNGIVEMDAVGNNFARIATKSQASTGGSIVDLGGDDTITAQDGTKIVLGGDGADTIKLGDGRALASNHIVIGDNGVVTYVPMLTSGGLARTGAGNVLSYETTDTLAATGGIDIITVGDGNNTILGGMAGDVITTDTGSTTRTGVDTIIGDNGIVEMDAVGNNFARIATKSQASTGGSIVDLGGNDTITAQDGTKIVLGGDGADTIKLGEGRVLASNHIVIGDNGVVNYVPMLTAGGLPRTGAGRVLSYETTDTLATTGGIDIITVGDGNNTILGGMA